MRPYNTIKFVNGMNQNTDDEMSPGFQTVQNMEYRKVGSAEAAKVNDTAVTYGDKVHSIGFVEVAGAEPVLAGSSTNLYRGEENIKNDFSGSNLEFSTLGSRGYITSKADGLWSYDGDGVYRAGSPVPTVGTFAAVAGSGTGFTGTYSVYVTFVNDNGYEGDPSEAITTPVLANEDIDLSNIPVNSDAEYNVVSRKIYIQGGTTPTYSSAVLAGTIADNTTTTTTITTAGIDATTTMDEDNELAPYASYIAEHYNVLFLGNTSTDENLLYYSKLQSSTTGVEQWPTTQAIRVSRSGDPIMWLEEWDGVLWVFTKKKIYQIIGSPGVGTLVTNFYLKESGSFKGTVSGRSVAFTPYGGFFLAEDGIRRFDANSSIVFSNEIKDALAERNTLTSAEQNACAAFWDDKYVLSYASGSSTVNNKTVIYDFRAQQGGITSPWTIHDQGYNDFAVDRGSNVLHCATASGIERFRNGTTYDSWEVKKELPNASDMYYARGKFQVDMEGTVTAYVYLDDTLVNTHTLTATSRSLITRRFPSGLSQRATIKLTGDAKSTQDKLWSIAYSAEPQRGKP